MTSSIFLVFLFLMLQMILLPAQSFSLPMNNLYTTNIATYDLITFTKISGDNLTFSSVLTSYPVAQNATTTVTIKIVGGSNTLVFGCGQKNTALLSSMYFGQMANTLGFSALSGQKIISGFGIPYNVSANVGDFITMKIDLHPSAMNVEFQKNSVSMGMAFGGLGDWGEIYIGLSLGQTNTSVQFFYYQVAT